MADSEVITGVYPISDEPAFAEYAVVTVPELAGEESLVDDLPTAVDFEVMAFGGQATVMTAQ